MARWLSLIAIIQQVSCGTGKSPATSQFDPTPAITVTISPGSAQISPGTSVQFLVSVQNASNPAVSWQVNGVPGGNSFFGTIAPSGAATASYTAPASIAATLTVTVTAVLQADATKFGSVMVTVNPSSGPQITIAPANSNVVAGASLQFTATVQNGPPAVIWEVNGLQGGSAQFGKITSTLGSPGALYTAPAQIPNPPVVTITGVLSTDSSISGSTTVTIVAPPVSVSVSPSTANVVSNGALQFSASVQNSSASLIWEVNGIPGGNQSDGTISSTGNYTATYSAPVVSSPLTVTVAAVLQTAPLISATAGVTVVPLNSFTGVYSWRNDNALTGENPQETKLTPSSVSGQFGKLFACPVDGAVFAQPLYVANVTIPSQGTHNVVYVATEHDSVYAFDADANPCQTLWHVSFINPATNVTTVPATDITGQTDIVPEIGITGTPVIDPTTATLYVVSKTKINQGATPSYTQVLHALDLATGAEKFNGPAVIQGIVNGTGDGSLSGKIYFDPLTENQRAALLLAGGNVYAAFDSYEDSPTFHGWLFAYDAANLKSAPVAFVSTPNGSNGGIGESGAAPSSNMSGSAFVVTSNGTFDSNGDYGETLLKLQVATGFAIANASADTFTPSNQATLNFTQKDFGSTGVLLLPDSAGSSLHPHLALVGSQVSGAGLSPDVYLLDRDNLGGFTSGGPDNVVQKLCLTANGASGLGASILGTPAYWEGNNTVYAAAAFDSLKAFPLGSGLGSGAFTSPVCPAAAMPSSQSADVFNFFGNSFGASPVISWDGSNPATGIIWVLDTSGYSATPAQPAILYAYKATDLTRLYVSPSNTSGPLPPAGLAVKFAVPTVANGRVYVGTQGELSVFGVQ